MNQRNLLIGAGLVICSILAALAYWRVAMLEESGTPVVSRDLFGSPVVEQPGISQPDEATSPEQLALPEVTEHADASGRLDQPTVTPETGPVQPWEPPEILAYA